MEPEQLRDCPSSLSKYEAVDLPSEYPQQQSRYSASSLAQDLIESIMEYEEEEDNCWTPDSKTLDLASPLAHINNQTQSPKVSFLPQNPDSPFPNDGCPLPPTNTPSTGHGVHSNHYHYLAGIQAATKLAMVTHHPYDQGLQQLRDSLAGLRHEVQLQSEEDVFRTAAAFIQFCRRQADKDLEKMFKAREW